MRRQVPAHCKAEIDDLLLAHAEWLEAKLPGFWDAAPDIHQVLGLCDDCGVLYQIACKCSALS
jgi:hypothetical protein